MATTVTPSAGRRAPSPNPLIASSIATVQVEAMIAANIQPMVRGPLAAWAAPASDRIGGFPSVWCPEFDRRRAVDRSDLEGHAVVRGVIQGSVDGALKLGAERGVGWFAQINIVGEDLNPDAGGGQQCGGGAWLGSSRVFARYPAMS